MCSSGGSSNGNYGGLESKSDRENKAKISAANMTLIGSARPGTYITATNSYVPGDDGSNASLGNTKPRRRGSLLTDLAIGGATKTLLGQ